MRFFFHFNKPASRARGHCVISLHYGGACHLVRDIIVNVPTRARINKRQPHFVMVGDADTINIRKQTAIIG